MEPCYFIAVVSSRLFDWASGAVSVCHGVAIAEYVGAGQLLLRLFPSGSLEGNRLRVGGCSDTGFEFRQGPDVCGLHPARVYLLSVALRGYASAEGMKAPLPPLRDVLLFFVCNIFTHIKIC